jgi:hypothetical protein
MISKTGMGETEVTSEVEHAENPARRIVGDDRFG